MSKLPIWQCRNKRDAKAMVDWVNEHLDHVRNPFLDYVKFFETMYGVSFEEAINRADKGDVEELRKLFPELARFIQRPKLKRGHRFAKNRENDLVGKAVDDVKVIRSLWEREFKKKNRPKDDLVSAEQIAADRNGVDVNTVINRLKKSRAE